MRADEDMHAQEAIESGSESLSEPTKKMMSFTAKVMTSSSAYI
jgi:ubiquinone biosynthesis monooxygenase Coq7